MVVIYKIFIKYTKGQQGNHLVASVCFVRKKGKGGFCIGENEIQMDDLSGMYPHDFLYWGAGNDGIYRVSAISD